MFFSLVDSLATFSNAIILLLNVIHGICNDEQINDSLETKFH